MFFSKSVNEMMVIPFNNVQGSCYFQLRVIQDFHMDSMDFGDIGYNFLIGSHGRVYEGRGWLYVGAHTKYYNSDSLGIAFIGTFTNDRRPTDAQLLACRLLLTEAVRRKVLVADYQLFGANQMMPTISPGEQLSAIIQTWPHWVNKTFY